MQANMAATDVQVRAELEAWRDDGSGPGGTTQTTQLATHGAGGLNATISVGELTAKVETGTDGMMAISVEQGEVTLLEWTLPTLH